jgi:uncharacterized membrane protein YhaH (DUF805 family)
MTSFEDALRPLRHYADFAGRSRRTEIALFLVLMWALTRLVGLATMTAGPDVTGWTLLILELAILCPLAAVSVRRLHDVGWSGWWALLALPLVGLELMLRLTMLGHPLLDMPGGVIPRMYSIPTGICGAALLILLSLRDQEEPNPNRYGPNPRYDDPGEDS